MSSTGRGKDAQAAAMMYVFMVLLVCDAATTRPHNGPGSEALDQSRLFFNLEDNLNPESDKDKRMMNMNDEKEHNGMYNLGLWNGFNNHGNHNGNRNSGNYNGNNNDMDNSQDMVDVGEMFDWKAYLPLYKNVQPEIFHNIGGLDHVPAFSREPSNGVQHNSVRSDVKRPIDARLHKNIPQSAYTRSPKAFRPTDSLIMREKTTSTSYFMALKEQKKFTTTIPIKEQTTFTTTMAEEKTYTATTPVEEQKIFVTTTPAKGQKIFTTTIPIKEHTTFTTATPVEEKTAFTTTTPVKEQKTFTTTTPVKERKTFTTTTPVKEQKVFTTTLPVKEQKAFISTTPGKEQKIFTTTIPVDDQKTFTTTMADIQQRIFTTTTPVKEQTAFPTTTPAKEQATFTTTIPVKERKKFTTTIPVDDQKAYSTTIRAEAQKLFTSAAPVKEQRTFTTTMEHKEQTTLTTTIADREQTSVTGAKDLRTAAQAESTPDNSALHVVQTPTTNIHLPADVYSSSTTFGNIADSADGIGTDENSVIIDRDVETSEPHITHIPAIDERPQQQSAAVESATTSFLVSTPRQPIDILTTTTPPPTTSESPEILSKPAAAAGERAGDLSSILSTAFHISDTRPDRLHEEITSVLTSMSQEDTPPIKQRDIEHNREPINQAPPPPLKATRNDNSKSEQIISGYGVPYGDGYIWFINFFK